MTKVVEVKQTRQRDKPAKVDIVSFPSLSAKSKVSEHLQLEPPNEFNGGGFYLGQKIYSYSPVDICVAALQASMYPEVMVVRNLTSFFDTHRDIDVLHNLFIAYENLSRGIVYYNTLAHIKYLIRANVLEKDEFIKLAPLTFKWRD